ncbi:NAD-dependent protein deacetylase [Aeromicrobium sp. Leaf350]|uniref:NAD-dependent protein deacetylase n=1 Tax=Aeromicrobium sp. Leaf350 TaxID=2876565 RepID=UPI001E3F4EA7|nr:NAD-dependent protein deacetylase [Aeromicrobium sp. Leaf350]
MSTPTLRLMVDAGDVLVLTGAGVSTDSGIPDYRGPNSTPRTPMTYQEFAATPEAQRHYWARAHVGWSRMHAADPNATHQLLAGLEAEGRLAGLITQNIDGLHGRAGHRDLVELHGAIDRVICLDCREVTPRTDLQVRLTELNPGWTEREAVMAPDGDVLLEDTEDFVVATCTTCDGRLKPDVVFFGESVPKPTVAHCFDLVERSASLLVLGSSLQVMSGLRFVRAAAKRGIPVAIVNRGTTRGDALATVKVEAGVAETLADCLDQRLGSHATA